VYLGANKKYIIHKTPSKVAGSTIYFAAPQSEEFRSSQSHGI